jgi:hypothetical protein
MSGHRAERECGCSDLEQHGQNLHCVHFNGEVIHWHEGGDRHYICGPDNPFQTGDGQTLHLAGEAIFSTFPAAEAEFRKRKAALLGRKPE